MRKSPLKAGVLCNRKVKPQNSRNKSDDKRRPCDVSKAAIPRLMFRWEASCESTRKPHLQKMFYQSKSLFAARKISLLRSRWQFRHGHSIYIREHTAAATTIGFGIAAQLISDMLPINSGRLAPECVSRLLGRIFGLVMVLLGALMVRL